MGFQFAKWTAHQPTYQAPGFSNAWALSWAKDFLKALGHTVSRSGDGSTYSGAGDVIFAVEVPGTPPILSTNLDAAGAHFELHSPDGLFGATVQWATATTGRVRFSFGEEFSAGSPDENTTGDTVDAANMITVIGGGTSGAPTYGTLCSLADDNLDLYISAQDATPWGFVVFGVNKSGAANSGAFAFFYDPVTGDEADDAAGVAYWNGATSCLTYSNMQATATAPVGWIAKGLAGAVLGRISALRGGNNSTTTLIPGALPFDPWSPDEDRVTLHPLTYGSSDGPKGVSTMLMWVGQSTATIKTGTRLTIEDPRYWPDWIVVDNVAIRWDGTALAHDPSAGAIYPARVIDYSRAGANVEESAPVTPDPIPQRIGSGAGGRGFGVD